MSTCINLREGFGGQYRIAFDPAYDHRKVPRAKLDPWMTEIRCKFGTIYPFGGDKLAVEVDYHPKAARALAALEGVTCHQAGDAELTFVFPAALFDRVAEIVRPKRRRRLSPEHRAQLAAHGFQKKRQAEGSPLFGQTG